jgi:hypothetical protein
MNFVFYRTQQHYQLKDLFYKLSQSKDLAKLLCDIAGRANLEQKANFAHKSKAIWQLICKDKWIRASTNKVHV